MCDLRKGFDLPQCICNKAPLSTFKGLLFNLHHHRAYSKTPQYILIISKVSIHIHMAYLFGPSISECVDAFLGNRRQKERVFKQMSPGKKKQKTVMWCVPSASIQTRDLFSITLISSSLPQLSLGTCDCTLSIRTKLLWLYSNCSLLNYILLLRTTQDRMREKGCTSHS